MAPKETHMVLNIRYVVGYPIEGIVPILRQIRQRCAIQNQVRYLAAILKDLTSDSRNEDDNNEVKCKYDAISAHLDLYDPAKMKDSTFRIPNYWVTTWLLSGKIHID